LLSILHKVSLIVDALYDVLKVRFSKPNTKDDKNMFSETKTNAKKIQNMVDT
jgi:hypothetical protein